MGPYPPVHQHDLSTCYFNACNPPGMDTAAVIEIGHVPVGRKLGPVGVATHQHDLVPLDPFGKVLFNLVAFMSVFRRAGWVPKPNNVHVTPKIPEPHFGHKPELVIH